MTNAYPPIYSINDLDHAAGVDAGVIGFKAFNLARMASLGLPVPEAFVLGTGWCHEWLADRESARRRLRAALQASVDALQRSTGLAFGGARKPLLVSVRSGAPVSMPGMMDTVLNIGLCDQSVGGLLRMTGNPRLVWDSYRRLIQQYVEVVLRKDGAPFAELTRQALDREAVSSVRQLDFHSLAALTREFQARFDDIAGEPFPQDPMDQLDAAIGAVFQSWLSPRAMEYRRLNDIDENLGTAVTVQRMVFGNAGGTSGAGVGFTRDPASGENQPYLDFLFNCQGEDVVSGRYAANDARRLVDELPQVAGELELVRRNLEREFLDAQEFEFTVQDGKLFLLQTRSAKRTPWAALRIAVEQVREGLIPPSAALERLAHLDLAALERHRLAPGAETAVLGEAVSAGNGVACGAIALDREAVRRFAEAGNAAILVREDPNTDDIVAISLAQGLLTLQGSRTAHAVVVARQLGRVCLVGCRGLRIDEAARTITLGGRVLAEGETICLDGDSGRVLAGCPQRVVERPDAWLEELRGWQAGLAAARKSAPRGRRSQPA